jgi:anti-anti-sigma factor
VEPQGIEVEVHSATAAIVTLRGEHDLDSRPDIAKALETASGRTHVLVDLSECTFIDSSVISALLRASNSLTIRGGLLELVIPSGAHRAVRNVFEIMGLQRLLPIHETRAAAIEYLDAPPPATTETGMRLRALSQIIDESLAETEERRWTA